MKINLLTVLFLIMLMWTIIELAHDLTNIDLWTVLILVISGYVSSVVFLMKGEQSDRKN